MSIPNRIAWTIFALGICLMFNMALYAMVMESDGGYRSWDQIQFHVRVFFGITLIPLAGPLLVYIWERSPGFSDALPDGKAIEDDRIVEDH